MLGGRSSLLGDVFVNSHPISSYVSFSKIQIQSLTECLLPATRRYLFPSSRPEPNEGGLKHRLLFDAAPKRFCGDLAGSTTRPPSPGF